MTLTDTDLTFYYNCTKCGRILLSSYLLDGLRLECRRCIMQAHNTYCACAAP